jgi:chaperonin GroES
MVARLGVKPMIEPRNDYVLVQTDAKQEKSRGGILLPDRVQEDRMEAVVLAVGPGGVTANGVRVPIDLKINDRVLIHQFAGNEIGNKEERKFLVRQDSILCKL